MLYNTTHNNSKELLPTKLQFKADKYLTWIRITNVVSTVEKGLLASLTKMLCPTRDPGSS
jgi:hypothetical protein